MKAAQGKALTPTSFVCDKKRRHYQSLLSVSLTVIAFNSPLILLSVLMSGTGKSQMLRLDQMHPVATLISWQRGSSFNDKLWVLQIMSSWTSGVCVGKLLTWWNLASQYQPRASPGVIPMPLVLGRCQGVVFSWTATQQKTQTASGWFEHGIE